MTDAPDFPALRAKRVAAIKEMVAAVCAEHGFDPATAQVHVSGAGDCYCACPDGPCEHQFAGWREFDEGRGGETVCRLCGQGAMSHSIRCGP